MRFCSVVNSLFDSHAKVSPPYTCLPDIYTKESPHPVLPMVNQTRFFKRGGHHCRSSFFIRLHTSYLEHFIYIVVKPCPSQNSLCSTSIYGHPMHSSICSMCRVTLPIFICFCSSTFLLSLGLLLYDVMLTSSVDMYFFHAYHLSSVNGSFAFHLFRSSGCSSSWQLWHRLTRLRFPSLS